MPGGKPLPVVVDLKEPCPVQWDTLDGSGDRRFCKVCQKHVVDLSALPADEVPALLASGACTSFRYRPDGSVVTRAARSGVAGRVMMAATLVALTACGSSRSEDADYPRLGGAMPYVGPPDEPHAAAGAGGQGVDEPAVSCHPEKPVP